ncbi:uncharacterized protein LOC124408999 [Diprion similis]|uniref:uncharacterized protein LOC124408999 n=1 Tax=Diprion similis TaxID=362088 RepID=UPI001EF8C72F|nr:uncharacterized protein LOC124408999 [Diprion similis]
MFSLKNNTNGEAHIRENDFLNAEPWLRIVAASVNAEEKKTLIIFFLILELRQNVDKHFNSPFVSDASVDDGFSLLPDTRHSFPDECPEGRKRVLKPGRTSGERRLSGLLFVSGKMPVKLTGRGSSTSSKEGEKLV